MGQEYFMAQFLHLRRINTKDNFLVEIIKSDTSARLLTTSEGTHEDRISVAYELGSLKIENAALSVDMISSTNMRMQACFLNIGFLSVSN